LSARWSSEWSTRWQRLAPRERRAVTWAAALVVATALWILAVAPAWRTLQQAPQQIARSAATLQAMRAQAGEAQDLRNRAATNKPTRADALRTVDTATRQWLGATARTVAGDDRVTVTLQTATPDALAHWLNDMRLNAALYPVQAHLERTGDADVRWQGTLLLGGDALGQP